MKFIRHLFIALCLMLTFSISGAIEFVGHDCCEDEFAATETENCVCVCVCCHATSVPVPTPAGLRAIPHSPVLALKAAYTDGDTGRLLESFIFTPPRA